LARPRLLLNVAKMDMDATLVVERRRDRTEDTLAALTRLLEAARRRSGLEALSVADSSGLLLAGAGPARLCEELAAWAPLVARPADNDTAPTCIDALERRTGRRRLSVNGIEVVVTTAGDFAPASGELDALAAGLRRILI
jgi:hypothetical protein